MAGVGEFLNELTEEDVKRTAIRFLKGYYKYRPRAGETKTSIDMRGQGGIVADGYLTFVKEDKSVFTATFEATAADTIEEVRFHLQPELLSWDSTVFAFLALTLTVVLTYLFDLLTVPETGLLLRILLLALWFSIYFLLGERLLLKWFRRYRYIYAIEQFKQYHADEQWIVIGDNVFPNYNDRHYRELRKQCIANGFGLILIKADGSAQLVITPSRTDVFGFRRRIVQFLSVNELSRRFRRGASGEWLQKFNGRLKNWIQPYLRKNLMRFQRTYIYQFVVSCICVLLCAGILYRELQDLPILYVNEKAYAKRMEALSQTSRIEVEEDLSDTVRVPFGETQEARPLYEQEDGFAQARDVPEVVISSEDSDELSYYNCARILQNRGNGYLLQESLHADLDQAEARISQLAGYNLRANAVWAGCFQAGSGYIVFLDEVLTDSLDAVSRAAGYEISWPDGIVLPEFVIISIAPD